MHARHRAPFCFVLLLITPAQVQSLAGDRSIEAIGYLEISITDCVWLHLSANILAFDDAAERALSSPAPRRRVFSTIKPPLTALLVMNYNRSSPVLRTLPRGE
jgi:hypothetical protein